MKAKYTTKPVLKLTLSKKEAEHIMAMIDSFPVHLKNTMTEEQLTTMDKLCRAVHVIR
jgi:hypothetical protein